VWDASINVQPLCIFAGTKCLSGSERRKGLPGGIQGNSVLHFLANRHSFIPHIKIQLPAFLFIGVFCLLFFEAAYTSFFKDKKS
jgi:hypothetical protein